jgi:hypothetical protein
LISVLSIVGGYVALICVAGLVGRHGSGAVLSSSCLPRPAAAAARIRSGSGCLISGVANSV